MLNPHWIKKDFPLLQPDALRAGDFTYLDNAATTQKPQVVIDALNDYYRRHNANIHRGVYRLAAETTRAYEEARARIAGFLHAGKPEEIVFVRGATEGINLVASSFVRPRLDPGDEVLISAMEHHSNLVPWQALCREKGARLRIIPMNERGELNLETYEGLLTPRTRMVALVHISNALGTVNPVREMTALAQARGIPVLIDAAQSAAHHPLDLQDLACDFLVCSGHKLFGPTGIGLLFGKEEHLQAMAPYQFGGEMIRNVTFEETIYADPPHRFEAGTPHIAGAIGLAAAVAYIQSIGKEAIRDHLSGLLTYASEQLTEIPGLRIIGQAAHKSAILSFVLANAHPHDVATILDHEGIAVRAGHHCTQPVMDFFGVPGTTRASFSIYNSREDADRLVRALRAVQNMFA